MNIFLLVILLLNLTLLFVTVWNAVAWPRVEIKQKNKNLSKRVSVLIPARDEGKNLAACLDAVLKQGEIVLEVLIYDDCSTDNTPKIIEEYEQRDARVMAVATAKLPDGWCGKTFACHQLALKACGEWLLFLDADARLNANAAHSILEDATKRQVSFLSCWPRLVMKSFWERVLMPLLNFVVFTLYPAPLALKRKDASLGLAHGSCLLARRDVYEKIGGHGEVRDEIFEDVRLAQIWRERGEKSLCLDGQRVVSVRMYSSLAEIWKGFQKNFFTAFRSETSFLLFIFLHVCFSLSPFILLTPYANRYLLLANVLCVPAMRFVLALRFRHPLWSVILHPLGEIILIALGLSSRYRCKSGRGVVWKGRRYRKGVSQE